MTWLRFFAAREDLLAFLEFAMAQPGLQVLETYSDLNEDGRRFTDYRTLAALPTLGTDPQGGGAAVQLSLWAPWVMPAKPLITRIDLKAEYASGDTFRHTVGGAGLVWLLCGGLHDRTRTLTGSALTWFREAGARAKFGGRPGPDDVDWAQHRRLVSRLQYHVTRRLAVARADGRYVLPHALHLHRAGVLLKDSSRAPITYTVGAD